MLKFIYGCLAFTAISLAAFIYLASTQDHFRGFGDGSAFALMDGAEVLAGDRSGAITQTGDGKVFGFTVGGEEQWDTSFDRFATRSSADRAVRVPNAAAKCIGPCPAAILTLPSGITAEGEADPGGALTRSLADADAHVFATIAPDAAFASVGASSELAWFFGGAPPKKLGIQHAGSVSLDLNRTHAVAGTVKGGRGSIFALERSGNRWKVVGEPVRQVNPRNACISGGGGWIGAAGNQFEIHRFGSAETIPIGPAVASGTCTIDSDAITIVYSAPENPTVVLAARYGFDNRRQWIRELGPNALLSGPGASTIVVRGGAAGTTIGIDARSGKETFREDLASKPLVADDGSIITANRHGEPTWRRVGGG